MLNMTQKQWVENQLIKNGKITRNECLRNYISRLGAIISMLKDDGYKFETGYVEFETARDYQVTCASKHCTMIYQRVKKRLYDIEKRKKKNVKRSIKTNKR